MERTEQILDELKGMKIRLNKIVDRLEELKHIYNKLPPLRSRNRTVQEIQDFFNKLQKHSLPKVVKIIDKLDRESDEWVKKLKKV